MVIMYSLLFENVSVGHRKVLANCMMIVDCDDEQPGIRDTESSINVGGTEVG